ncbi:unnamed protein product [Haemonchus placei]|uniref:CUB domain-containing protein n=1 Tax=Haemonchus placei TaxID=6290 RepID=A0A0N4WJW0_HAEPC|nr:unnamed protein product [Haemonchus placei]
MSYRPIQQLFPYLRSLIIVLTSCLVPSTLQLHCLFTYIKNRSGFGGRVQADGVSPSLRTRLTALSGAWREQNSLALLFPSAPFGCSVSHCEEVSWRIDPPSRRWGPVCLFLFADGSFTLADGSLLIWTPDKEGACKYIIVSRLTGYRLNTI